MIIGFGLCSISNSCIRRCVEREQKVRKKTAHIMRIERLSKKRDLYQYNMYGIFGRFFFEHQLCVLTSRTSNAFQLSASFTFFLHFFVDWLLYYAIRSLPLN